MARLTLAFAVLATILACVTATKSGGKDENPYYPGGGGKYPSGGGDYPGGGGDYPGGGGDYPGGGGRPDKGGGGLMLPFKTGSSAKMYIRHIEALCDIYSPEGHPFSVARRPAKHADDDEDDTDDDFVFIKNGVWCNVTAEDEDDEYENFQVPASCSKKGRKSSAAQTMDTLTNAFDEAFAKMGRALGLKTIAPAAVQAPSVDRLGYPGGGPPGTFSQDGFIILATNFISPDIFSGDKIYLKSQTTGHFCRSGSKAEGYVMICDVMSSGPEVEFRVTSADDKDDIDPPSRRDNNRKLMTKDSGSGNYPSGGGGDGPGGGFIPSFDPTDIEVYIQAVDDDDRYCEADDDVFVDFPIRCIKTHRDHGKHHKRSKSHSRIVFRVGPQFY